MKLLNYFLFNLFIFFSIFSGTFSQDAPAASAPADNAAGGNAAPAGNAAPGPAKPAEGAAAPAAPGGAKPADGSPAAPGGAKPAEGAAAGAPAAPGGAKPAEGAAPGPAPAAGAPGASSPTGGAAPPPTAGGANPPALPGGPTVPGQTTPSSAIHPTLPGGQTLIPAQNQNQTNTGQNSTAGPGNPFTLIPPQLLFPPILGGGVGTQQCIAMNQPCNQPNVQQQNCCQFLLCQRAPIHQRAVSNNPNLNTCQVLNKFNIVRSLIGF